MMLLRRILNRLHRLTAPSARGPNIPSSGYYAEDDTDRWLRETFFQDTRAGAMVEVGAAGPTFLSMSRHFRESGWRVLAIEPNPHFVAMHEAAGSAVLQYACGEEDADGVDFEVVFQPVPMAGGHVSYESFSALRVKESYRVHNPSITAQRIKVNVRRLDTILAQHAPDLERLDLLSIDVEGWELEVLNGFSLERYAPRVVLIENFVRDPGYETYMRRRGYRLYADRFPNQVYTPA
jgi:FkbM family methyltransferase